MSSELFALSIPFRDLAPVVDEWRERTCETKPSHGIPPHVTLLFPAPRDVEAADEAEKELSAALPLRSRASSVVLFGQVAPGRWRENAELPL